MSSCRCSGLFPVSKSRGLRGRRRQQVPTGPAAAGQTLVLGLLAWGCPAERTLTQQPQRCLLSNATHGSLKHLHPWRRGQPLTARQGRNQTSRAAAAGHTLQPVSRLESQACLFRADKLQQQPARLSPRLGLGPWSTQRRQGLPTAPAPMGRRLVRHLTMTGRGTGLGPSLPLLCRAQQLLLMPQKLTWRVLIACFLLGRSSSGRFTPPESKRLGFALDPCVAVAEVQHMHCGSAAAAPVQASHNLTRCAEGLLCHTKFSLNG